MMKQATVLLSILLLLAVCGCVQQGSNQTQTTGAQNAPTESKPTVKYVEVSLINGMKIGGKYVNESVAFVSIVPMYVIDANGIMQPGSGKEYAIANNLVLGMATIDDPTNLINQILAEQAARAGVAKKEEPKLPIRNVTYDLGPSLQATATNSVTEQSGVIVQDTNINAGATGYATIEIKTYSTPINKDQLINEALEPGKINDFNVYEKGNYDAVLANGDKVTVHLRECAAASANRGKFSVAAFSLDANTVVKVTSSFDQYRTTALLRTLKIGEVSYR